MVGKRHRKVDGRRAATRTRRSAGHIEPVADPTGGLPAIPEIRTPLDLQAHWLDERASRAPSVRRGRPAGQSRRERRARWADRLSYGFVGALGVALVAWALTSAGLFQPPPTDLSTIDPAATQIKKNDPVGTRVSAQPPQHVPNGQKVTYGTTPPNSGPHWGAPGSWGIKDAAQPDERIVHNLEHGGVLIAYNALSAEQQARLVSLVRGLQSAGYRKVILQPYPALGDTKVAATAWGWILRLEELDEKAVLAFVKAHHEGTDAPEPNAP
jgi:hypothetical protein